MPAPRLPALPLIVLSPKSSVPPALMAPPLVTYQSPLPLKVLAVTVTLPEPENTPPPYSPPMLPSIVQPVSVTARRRRPDAAAVVRGVAADPAVDHRQVRRVMAMPPPSPPNVAIADRNAFQHEPATRRRVPEDAKSWSRRTVSRS
jgi:hypothetical protein